MKFDGAKYLETKIKENFKINNSIDNFCTIFDGNNSMVRYGSLKLQEDEGKKYFLFLPSSSRKVEISFTKIGNITKGDRDCHASFSAMFTECQDSMIDCLFNLEKDNNDDVFAKAVIVIKDENDPYKGIYYVNMHHYDSGRIRPMLSYFDGDVLDILYQNHSAGEVKELIGLDPSNLEKLGFSHDLCRVFEKEEVCGHRLYSSYSRTIADTFKKGTYELFKNWIDKSFQKQIEENKDNKGPGLRKTM